MSRLGKLPIELPSATEAKIDSAYITVKGPKGELKTKLSDIVKVELKDNIITVSVDNPNEKKEKSFWGLYRSLINNMVIGVTNGFEKKLEVVGVGYRATMKDKDLVFNVGYSHPVDFKIPEGISARIEANIVTISGADKQLVGETAARIRKIRKPEPYKGKGIKYVDEVLRRKEGKSAAKGSAK